MNYCLDPKGTLILRLQVLLKGWFISCRYRTEQVRTYSMLVSLKKGERMNKVLASGVCTAEGTMQQVINSLIFRLFCIITIKKLHQCLNRSLHCTSRTKGNYFEGQYQFFACFSPFTTNVCVMYGNRPAETYSLLEPDTVIYYSDHHVFLYPESCWHCADAGTDFSNQSAF